MSHRVIKEGIKLALNIDTMITSNKMDKALNFPFPFTASSKLENRSASKQ